MRVLLVSTYELGHQPWHVASPAGALRRAGHDVRAIDLAVEPWEDERFAWAEAIAFSVPMHTAMRLAARAAERARTTRPDVPICFYGLYAGVAHDRVLGALADRLIAGEYEPALVAWAAALDRGLTTARAHTAFGVPARDVLPPLDRYARLEVGAETRLAGYVEASHGCAHRCKHCPVAAVYDGRTRLVDTDAVLADVDQLVGMGARHLTFGDPDFLNGPHHAVRVVDAVHRRFPDLTFDCTVKVEHVLRHRDVWPRFADAGCLFVVSALETMNDDILRRLDKGHTAADAAEAVRVLRAHGIEVRPSFLPFTPWTSLADVADIVNFVADHDLVDNVDPVQYSIRLLLPDGSLVLDAPDFALGSYDADRLTWTWASPDPAVDGLQQRIAAIVERAATADEAIGDTFGAVDSAVRDATGEPPRSTPVVPRTTPRLTEAWFCCAEPTDMQFTAVGEQQPA